MSNKGAYPDGSYPFPPTAPPPSNQHHGNLPSYIPDRPPPPSYEESQKMNSIPNAVPSAPLLTPAHFGTSYPQMNQGYGHVPEMQQYQQQPLIPVNVQQNYTGNQQPIKKSVHVLEYASGARFNGRGGGSVTVPPPPPGVAPTPAQMAALQGQPVILQKKKKSFF